MTATSLTLEQAATWITNLDQQIEELTDQRSGLQAWILTQLNPGEKEQAGDHTITVRRPPRRLNTKKFETVFPAKDFPQLYTTRTTIDTTAVKQQFAETYLEENGLYTSGRPSVVIK